MYPLAVGLATLGAMSLAAQAMGISPDSLIKSIFYASSLAILLLLIFPDLTSAEHRRPITIAAILDAAAYIWIAIEHLIAQGDHSPTFVIKYLLHLLATAFLNFLCVCEWGQPETRAQWGVVAVANFLMCGYPFLVHYLCLGRGGRKHRVVAATLDAAEYIWGAINHLVDQGHIYPALVVKYLIHLLATACLNYLCVCEWGEPQTRAQWGVVGVANLLMWGYPFLVHYLCLCRGVRKRTVLTFLTIIFLGPPIILWVKATGGPTISLKVPMSVERWSIVAIPALIATISCFLIFVRGVSLRTVVTHMCFSSGTSGLLAILFLQARDFLQGTDILNEDREIWTAILIPTAWSFMLGYLVHTGQFAEYRRVYLGCVLGPFAWLATDNYLFYEQSIGRVVDLFIERSFEHIPGSGLNTWWFIYWRRNGERILNRIFWFRITVMWALIIGVVVVLLVVIPAIIEDEGKERITNRLPRPAYEDDYPEPEPQPKPYYYLVTSEEICMDSVRYLRYHKRMGTYGSQFSAVCPPMKPTRRFA